LRIKRRTKEKKGVFSKMNRSAVKVQERNRTDLRHNEVDGHFLAGKKIKDFRVVEGSSC